SAVQDAILPFAFYPDYDIDRLRPYPNNLYLVVERQHFMHKKPDWSRSGYMIAMNYGVLIEAIRQCRAKFTKSRFPQGSAWKKDMGLTSSKELSRKVATEIFPEAAKLYWPRKKDEGLAESALLCYYGAKYFGLLAQETPDERRQHQEPIPD
ncbi:MAG: hypothetical protein OXE50_15105, partial [Chloroflexi bacterium]|nr:hypothetical protein [Chloroflexota bacterium]